MQTHFIAFKSPDYLVTPTHLSSISCHSLHPTSDVATLDCLSLFSERIFKYFLYGFGHAVLVYPKCTAQVTWISLPKGILFPSLLTAWLRHHWHDKLHICKVYNLKSFEMGICLWKHHHSKYSSPPRVSLCSFVTPSSCPPHLPAFPRQPLICLLLLQINLYFLHFYIHGIIEYVHFPGGPLSPSIHIEIKFEIQPRGSVYQ